MPEIEFPSLSDARVEYQRSLYVLLDYFGLYPTVICKDLGAIVGQVDAVASRCRARLDDPYVALAECLPVRTELVLEVDVLLNDPFDGDI